MKTFAYCIATYLFFSVGIPASLAQEKKNAYNDKQNISVILQKEPEFKGGEKALFKYFSDSLHYSNEAISKKIAGEVMVSFDIMPDSNLTNIKIFSGVGYGVDEEVVKLFKKIKFGPSIQNGVTLRMNMIISIPVRAAPKIVLPE